MIAKSIEQRLYRRRDTRPSPTVASTEEGDRARL